MEIRCPSRCNGDGFRPVEFNLAVTFRRLGAGSTSPARRTPPGLMGKTRLRMSKKRYQAQAGVLREQLVQLQVELKQVPFKVLLIVAGPEGAGRGNLLNTLAEWLDPRGVETFSYHP